jgi:branched-chain amino acid transport system permease protein
LIGAVLFIAIPEVLRVANELRLVIFGVVLVLFALYAPRGVCGLVVSLRRWFDAKGAVHAGHS